MGFFTEIESEVGTAPTKTGPKKANGHSGTSWYDLVNAVPIVEVLDWLGIEHDDKRVECRGCGEGMSSTDVAIVGNAVKCSHSRCSDAGPSSAPGLRSAVDLTMLVRGLDKQAAVLALAEQFRIELPKAKPDNVKAEHAEQQAAKPIVLTADDIFATPNHIDTLVPGLGIKPGPVVMAVARSGIGKSVILQDAAISSALGRSWWNLFPVERALKVLWIDLEQGKQTTLLRFKRLALARDLTPDDLRGKLDVSISPKVENEAQLLKLFEGYDLAFIDCFRVLSGHIDENDSRVREPLDMCARASAEADCGVVMVHHGRKATENNRGGARDVTRGSSAIQDAVDAVYFLDRDGDEPEGPINCQCTKVPRATGKAPKPWTLEIQDVDLQVSADVIVRDGGLTVVGSRTAKADPFEVAREHRKAKTSKILDELVELFRKDKTLGGAKAIATKLGHSDRDIFGPLALLIDDGRVVATGSTRDRQHTWKGEVE